MNSVFATATGTAVSISAEALVHARTTLSQASSNFDDTLATSQSPLKSAASGAPVPVDPESLKVIKRKFAEYDDDSSQSPAKKHSTDEPDYSSMFRRAGSGKAIKISDSALSVAKRTMGADENDATESDAEPSFTSPIISSLLPAASAAAAASASTSTTPFRSTDGSQRGRRRPPGAGGSHFKSPFNSPFRPPIAASPTTFASPLTAQPPAVAATAAATPATATASPLSRMCLNTPASSSRSGVTIRPINTLNRTSSNFTLRVRVTERTGSIVSYGPKGDGRFCCWLSDASDGAAAAAAAVNKPTLRLEAEAGGAYAERAAAVLQYGKVYDISVARLCARKPAPDNPRGIVLFFDEKTLVSEVCSPPSSIARLRHLSSTVPLCNVTKEGEIDLAGIVRSVSVSAGGPPSPLCLSSSTPSPPPLSSPDVIPSVDVSLVDQNDSLVLTLSNDYHKAELKPGDLLLVYRASARLVNGKTLLRVSAVGGRTKLLLNPETDDGRVVALRNWGRSGQWAALGAAKMRSIASIREKTRTGGGEEGAEWEFVTKAMIANVDAAAEQTVEDCATCGGRITKDTTICNCARHGILRKLQLDVDVSDGTGLLKATAVGSVAETLVGVVTKEAVGLLRWNRDEWYNQCRRVFYESRVFKIRRDKRTPLGLSIVEVLPVPHAAYLTLIGKKLDKKKNRSESVI